MYSLAMTFGFIVPSSASVETVFFYFNKVSIKDRQKLAPETLHLLFLYVDAEKIEILVINFVLFSSNLQSNPPIFKPVPSRVI